MNQCQRIFIKWKHNSKGKFCWLSSGMSSFSCKSCIFGKVSPGTYKTFPKRLHLLRGVYLEIRKKRRYSFGPLQNTLPPLNQEEDSERAIPMSDKETCEMEYKRYLVLNT